MLNPVMQSGQRTRIEDGNRNFERETDIQSCPHGVRRGDRVQTLSTSGQLHKIDLAHIRSLMRFACMLAITLTVRNAPADEASLPDTLQTPPALKSPFTREEAQECLQLWSDFLMLDSHAVNSIGQQLTLIPPGDFLMGNHEAPEVSARFAAETGDVNVLPVNYRDEYPRHAVTISQPFYLGTFEVIRGEFRLFVNETNYRTEAERDGKGGLGYSESSQCVQQHPAFHWQNPGYSQTDDHPVVNITWDDAAVFCRWLSRRESKQYRLPTEAEWEYACRAGSAGRTTAGDVPADLEHDANVGDVSCQSIPGFSRYTGFYGFDDGHPFTAPVGRYQRNPLGLHDMHGNVWEWCNDFYESNYYQKSPKVNPPGPDTGTFHVYRGGGWMNGPAGCRSSRRGGPSPVNRCNRLGFRVALQLTPT